MATVELTGDKLTVHVEGIDRILALKSRLDVPLEHVLGAEADPAIARSWWKGLRLPGTWVPGVVTAGTFFQPRSGELQGFTFWDVHNPEQTVVISLAHEHYARLVIGVKDPAATVAAIQAALQARGGL